MWPSQNIWTLIKRDMKVCFLRMRKCHAQNAMAESDSTPRILTFCKTAVISRDFCRFRLDVVVVVMKHVCTQWYSAIEWTKQFKTCTHRLLKNSITFNIFPIFLFGLYFWQLIMINCLLEIRDWRYMFIISYIF